MAAEVFGADEQEDVELDLAAYVELATATLVAEGVREPAEVSLLFVDEPSIAALNERFMGKQGPTDVLSFPIEDEGSIGGRMPDAGSRGPGSDDELDDGPEILLGDVVICPAVAKANAEERGRRLVDELSLLVVHGILHLLGWDHVVDEEAERMEAREQILLERCTPEALRP